jgi:hypothetical protein
MSALDPKRKSSFTLIRRQDMPCVLRVSGRNLDLNALLDRSTLKAFRTWRQGEPRVPAAANSKINADSGACFDVSSAGFEEFAKQQEDATAFLCTNRSSIQRLTSCPGVEYAQLDFGIDWGRSWIHSDVLSPAFLRAAADAGISVEISHYREEEVESPHQLLGGV